MSSRRRFLRALGPAVLLAVGGAYALASWNWCGPWPGGEPVVQGASAEGTLSAGAGQAAIDFPKPVVVAGYGAPRPEASRAERPLFARALVLDVGGTRVGLVTVELLTVPEPLADEVRGAVAGLNLAEVWVVATHAHSSMGGYDDTLVSEMVGTGRYRPEARAAVVNAAAESLRLAAASVGAATLEVGEGSLEGLVVPRDDEPAADPRLLLARLRGAGGKPVGELVVLAAHPTLRPRKVEVLSPDYPGALAEARAARGGVSLVLQGQVGNASANVGEPPPRPDERVPFYAEAVGKRVEAVKPAGVEVTRLSFARARVPLPRPDASRLVPSLFRAAGDNFLCSAAPREADVSLLAVGPLRLLLVPAEVTPAAGARLEGASGARVVSLADGYLGYVNTAEHVTAVQAESRRQYFAPGLLQALERAARAAAERP